MIKTSFMRKLFFVLMQSILSLSVFASDNPDESICGDLDYRKRFEKELIGELDAFGGGYLGNYILTGWAAGGRLFMVFNHIFSFGGEYLYTPPSVDPLSSFAQVQTSTRQQIIDGQLAISWPIVFGFGDEQLPMDLYMTVGGGTININSGWSWLALVGGGLKMYLNPEWIALRIDVNSYMHNTPTIRGDKFSTNIAFLAGLAFYFPYRPVH